MKTSKRVLCVALLIALTLSLCAMSASADTAKQNTQKWNIMLVIDGSGSLDHTNGVPTDPKGLRYYAVANFLGTLDDENVKVGAIVFTASYDGSKEYEKMRKCVKVETELMPLSNDTRKRIMNAIDPEKAFCVQDIDDYKLGANPPQTDIGTALRAAYEKLAVAPDEGQKSAIFLFTDGKTEVMTGVEEESKKNGQIAVEGIRNNGYILCGIYLNGANVKNEEVEDLVYRANGTTLDRYMPIKEAQECIEATDMFLRAMNYQVDERSDIFTTSLERQFTIPGVGISSATVRINTVTGEPLPAGLVVKFLRPDGYLIEGAEAEALCFSWRSVHKNSPSKLLEPISRSYKLDPMPGTWTVYVEVPPGNLVQMRYSPTFNKEEVKAELDCVPAVDAIAAGDDVEFHAYLSQNGRLTDPAKYDHYECILNYKYPGEPEQTVKMTLSKNDGFVATLPFKDYGGYEVYATFTALELEENTNTITINLQNAMPETKTIPTLNLTHGLFQPKETDFDLSPYASDREDGNNLTYQLDNAGDCDPDGIQPLSQDGAQFKILHNKVGSGTLHFKVYDKDGGSGDLYLIIKNRNMTPVLLLCIGVAILMLALIAVMIIRYINRVPSGKCTLSFHVGDQPFDLEPPVPGTGATKRRTNMLAIVDSVVRPDSDRIDSSQIDEVRSFVDQYAGELRVIKVKTAHGKVKTDFSGKKQKVIMLRVTGKGMNVKLYNRSVRLVDGIFEFGFYPPDENLDDDFGYDSNEEDNTYVQNAEYGDYDPPVNYDGGSSYTGGSSYNDYSGSNSYGDYDEGTSRAFDSRNTGGSGGSNSYGDYDEGTTGAFSNFDTSAGGYGGYDEGTTGAFNGYGGNGGSNGYGDYDEGTTGAFAPRR